MNRFARTVSIVFMLAFLGGSKAVLGQEATTATVKPDVAASVFYNWYLNELDEHRDPLSGDQKTLVPYVTASLLHEITRTMESPGGIDADYFIQAQDYLDDWVQHISTSDTRLQPGFATTIVTLGGRPKAQYRLSVTLQKESGVWKIRRVKRLPVLSTKSTSKVNEH